MVSESLMFPDPEALKPVVPPEAVAVQESELMAGLSDRGSVTEAPVAVEGPELEATIVEVIEDPWSLSLLVMARVAWPLRVSVSVAVTVEASEALAVAVFESVPVAEDPIAAVTVYVTDPWA